MFGFLKKVFGSAQDRQVRKYRKIVEEINRWDEEYKQLTDDELRAKTPEFKQRLSRGESLDHLLPEAYAVVKAVCRRLVGTEVHVSGYDQKWDMVPFDVQLIGAIAMHNGSIAEMQTGEGKTLTAALPLYLNALTEKPVHLVTVNDYLVERDCQWIGAILRWLGLTTGALTSNTPMEQRKEVYENDVVYGTSSEFGFDYLRDNSMAQSKEQQTQRGHYYAIVDEIDSILIDEARTPLIISGPVPESRQMYDELKGGVSELVRRQRDLCNKMATDAKRVIDKVGAEAARSKDPEVEEAFKKLWLVGKGTPRNRLIKRVKEDPDLRAALDSWDLYYYADQNKDEKNTALAQLFMIVDERANEFELTDKGIALWNELKRDSHAGDDFVMLDLGYELSQVDEDTSLDEEGKVNKKLEIQEEDARRKERTHNLRQLLRAHLLMEKDVDYIVSEEKIVIIDENTGRPQPGRRFSDGLHQAIEAKEGVEIQKETQTYATITLQNYFRMYDKLSGMTGTAITEAGEFKDIYKLNVLQIPTHRPCIRTDENDEIYMTEREKYQAIIRDVKEIHEKGRPILIGTESVDVSEKLSRVLRQNNLNHVVLNAKNHAREAEIIAHAGRRGAITVATNMAGRGTDIKIESGLGELGGLHVAGAGRHQSRRIDRQLRGRCARQGDPGSSKFYICFEDTLLRLFASPTLTAMIQKFRPPEGEPISAGILTKSIETAQKRVEQRNFTIRKHTLEYDDVMNRQRQEIYTFRNDVLHSDELQEIAKEMLETVIMGKVDEFLGGRSPSDWDLEGFREWILSHFPVTIEEDLFDGIGMEEIEDVVIKRVLQVFDHKLSRDYSKIAETEKAHGVKPVGDPVQGAIRNLMIREIDHLWQEHLLTMDHLRSDVSLRTVGQRDPLMEFKQEAFRLFEELGENLREAIARQLFKFEILTFKPEQLQQILSHMNMERDRSFASEIEHDELPEQQKNEAPQPVHAGPRVGRNDNCPCGSGKKYKNCCGK